MKNELKIKSISIQTKLLEWKVAPKACLYRITNLDDGKKYWGVHKYKVTETPGDGTYWHSSKNKEFIKVCKNPKSNLLYETIEYGDYDVMTVREAEELSTVDAVNNDMYYNLSNGSPAFKPHQLDKVRSTYKMLWKWGSKEWGDYVDNQSLIQDCPYPIQVEDSEKIYNSGGKQVKVMMDNGLISYISGQIDKPHGTYNRKCKPVLFIGDDVFNGHHTKSGVYMSNFCDETPTMRVPESVIDGWTEAEKRLLANMFNPKPPVRENSMSVGDAVKQIKDAYASNGIPAHYSQNYEMLEGLGFNPTEINKIINDAAKDIERNYISYNTTWIDWSSSGWKTELKKLKKMIEGNNSNSLITYSSTDSLSLTPLEKLHDWFYHTDEDNFLQETNNEIDKLIVFTHIPLPSSQEKYSSSTGEGAKFESRLTMFCEPFNVEVKVILLPTETPDSKTNGDSSFWGTRQAALWARKNGLQKEQKELSSIWKKEQKDKK